MSNPESFIDEVTEELRRDRLYATFRRYGWIAILAVVLIVGGATYNEYRKASERNRAQALGDAIIAALEDTPEGQRAEALAAIDARGEAKAIVGLLAAAEGGGAEMLRALAADAELPAVWRELAAFKAVLADAELTPEGRIAELEPLTVPGGPYRVLALEQIALARIELGENDTALALLRDIRADGEAPAGLRRRAAQLIVALGGSLDAA